MSWRSDQDYAQGSTQNNDRPGGLEEVGETYVRGTDPSYHRSQGYHDAGQE